MRRSLIVSFLVLAACGPRALREEDGAPTLSLGGHGSRRIETLTDLEEVRDVLVTADGAIWVATDGGLLHYGASGDAQGELIEGLPSPDVLALAEDDGALLVATAAGVVRMAGDEVTPIHDAPSLGHVTDLERTRDGTIWMCALGGVARRTSNGWEPFGEQARCTTLAATPEGQLWVGTTAGLWYVEGDVIREHSVSGGIPEGYVRAIVPVQPGKIVALVQGPSAAKIAHWDGERWYGYTLRGMNAAAVDLVRRGSDVLLVSPQRILTLAPTGTGVALVALDDNEGTVRSFRGRSGQSTAAHRPAQMPGPNVLAEPVPLAEVPENPPTVRAPRFVARPLDVQLPGRAYASFVYGSDAFVAIANAGVLRIGRENATRILRSGSLVPEELQVATDGAGTVWMLARNRQLAKLVNRRLRRVSVPSEYAVSAVAAGEHGAYLVALEPSAGENVVRVLQHSGRGFRPILQRRLVVPTRITAIPFAGVAPDSTVWAALRIVRETGDGERMRGVAVLDPSREDVIYHHFGVDRATGGLPLPDEVSELEFDTDGNAWFATLSGLVRVGGSQAVVFGEARGVRGEVVTDVAISQARIWLASAEGLASYDRQRFDYSAPSFVQRARPRRLATDPDGRVWATSDQGLLLYADGEWVLIDRDDGLPENEIVDVEADGTGRVWVLTRDRILALER